MLHTIELKRSVNGNKAIIPFGKNLCHATILSSGCKKLNFFFFSNLIYKLSKEKNSISLLLQVLK